MTDTKAPCPTCSELVDTWLLCEHDDPDTGPLCVDVCCPHWHETKKAA